MRLKYGWLTKSGRIVSGELLSNGGRKLQVELEGGGLATIELTREDLAVLVGRPAATAPAAS